MRITGLHIGVGAVLLSLLPSGPAGGQSGSSVVIIQSGKHSAYQEVVSGFTQTVTGVGSTIFELPGNPEEQLEVRRKILSGPAPPGVILAIGTQATQFAQKEFLRTPLVFCLVTNPDRLQLSGPFITGIDLLVSPSEQLETLSQAVPGVKRLGVIYNPDISQATVDKGNAAGRELGIVLVEKRIRGTKEIANAIKDMMWVVDALWMIPDPTIVSKESFQYLLQTSIERRIPLLAFSEGFVKGGALLALAPDYEDIGRQAGLVAREILGGKSPGSIPLKHPKGHLILNLNTAQALGVNIPPEILGKADKIY